VIKKYITIIGVVGLLIIITSNIEAKEHSIGLNPSQSTKEASIIQKVPAPPPILREQIINIRQQAKEERQKFREKLEEIKNERKKATVERIDERVSTMNKNYVLRMSKALDKLDMVLKKISEKTTLLKNKGREVGSLESAIASAKDAIDSARIAVDEQAQKSYVIEITKEAFLRANVGKTVSEFRTDLRDVHKLVVDAKQEVYNAERELVTYNIQDTAKTEQLGGE